MNRNNCNVRAIVNTMFVEQNYITVREWCISETDDTCLQIARRGEPMLARVRI